MRCGGGAPHMDAVRSTMHCTTCNSLSRYHTPEIQDTVITVCVLIGTTGRKHMRRRSCRGEEAAHRFGNPPPTVCSPGSSAHFTLHSALWALDTPALARSTGRVGHQPSQPLPARVNNAAAVSEDAEQ